MQILSKNNLEVSFVGLAVLTASLWTLLPDGEVMAANTNIRSMTWGSVNDTVMGGRSSSDLTWNKQNELVWTGRLSLENNGGFVSIRTQGAELDWAEYDGLEVVLDGAGRDIQVTAQRRDMTVRAGGYRALIHTQGKGETRIFVPFSAFVLKRFGREINGPTLTSGLQLASELGLLLADKREGPFQVILKSIKPARYSDSTRRAPGVRSKLSAAIEKGVPVFNAGDAKGCATIYRSVLTELLDSGKLGSANWSLGLVKTALSESLKQDASSAAWTLRRAMDSLLRSL
ncbi:MAG: CIA30 family protein [Deltaproteobacteria bacterium]|nr:CIA30 family protein [Deltaproteobacteria bacterium]